MSSAPNDKTLEDAYCPRCGTTRPHLIAHSDTEVAMTRRICLRCDNVLDTPVVPE